MDSRMAIQSMMFSSTWQILESYLEDSPSSVRKTPQDVESRKDRASPIIDTKVAISLHDTAENSKALPETPDSSRPSSQSDSVANSPASSKTSASFGDEYPLKIIPRKEIRLRRTPQGAEPRVKNLTLTRSNGATNLRTPASVTSAHPISATSNYDNSPAIESPPDLPRPPPPPPKLFDKSVQRVPVARKPVQANSVARINKETSTSKPMGNLLSFNNAAPASVGNSSLPRAPVDPLNQSSNSRQENKPPSFRLKSENLPPRSDSLVKGVSIAKLGLRPAHKKSASSMSQNKELPPNPPLNKTTDAPMMKEPSYARLPEGFFELPSQSSGKEPIASDSKGQSNAGLSIFNSLRAESPLPDIAELETPAEGRNPFEQVDNEARNAPLGSKTLQASKPPMQREPRRPGFIRTDTSTSQGSNTSTVTSSSLTAPFSQPSLRSRGRAPSNSDLRARSRSRSNSSRNERFRSPQQPQNAFPPRTASSTSAGVSSQNLEVPSRSTTPQVPRSNSPPQASGSLPGVPEVRSPLIAPELKPSHFSCYTQHRPLLLSSNVMAPILCMTCKQDSEQMWKCGWCCLRICTGCKGALGEMRGNLKRMLAGAESGQLKIGRDRVFEAPPPIERSNTPASIMSINSNPRSQIGSSKGPSPDPSRGQLPRSGPSPMLNPGQFPSRGPSPNPMQGRPPPRNMPNGLRAGPPPSNLRPGPPPPPPPMNDPMQPPPQVMRPRANSNRSDFSFERASPPTAAPPKMDNSKPLPPPGLPRGIGAPFGNIPIGISNGPEMRRPVPLPSNPRKAGKKSAYKDDDDADGDGQVTPDFDLGFDVGPGGMAAGMRGMNPNLAATGPRLPPNPAMGLGIGSLNNGKPRGLRNKLLMT